MQLYGYPQFLEDPYEMAMPVEPFMGQDFYPFDDMSMFMDMGNMEEDVDAYFDRLGAATGSKVTRRYDDEEIESDEEETPEDDEQEVHPQ